MYTVNQQVFQELAWYVSTSGSSAAEVDLTECGHSDRMWSLLHRISEYMIPSAPSTERKGTYLSYVSAP